MSNQVKSKDSQWLQIDICREFAANKCSKVDCLFAHPPQNVDVVGGKVTACFDSFKGRCNREICKYFHPPSNLMDQLILKGRNHLAIKNSIVQHNTINPSMGFVPFSTEVPTLIFPPEHSGPKIMLNNSQTSLKRTADSSVAILENYYASNIHKRSRCYDHEWSQSAMEIPFSLNSSVSYQPIFQFPAPAERELQL